MQGAQAQTAGLAFLRIGTNAAALGMGSAQASSTDDAFSTYWNPAGLAAGRANSAALTHHVWIGDTRLYSLSARFQAGRRGGLGLAVTAAGSGDIPARSGPGDPEGFFDAQFASVGLSYGRAFGPLRLGVTAKYLVERIFEFSTNGYAFDFGGQLDLLDGVAQLGVSGQHFGDMAALNIEATELPRTLRGGIAVYPFRVLTEDDDAEFFDTHVTAEVAHRLSDDQTEVHVGAAVQVLETILVRGGVLTNNALWRYSLGVGVEFDALRFDYAYLPFRSGFGRSGHVLTLLYFW